MITMLKNVKKGDLVLVKQFDLDTNKFVDCTGIIMNFDEETQLTLFPYVDIHLFNCDRVVKCGVLQIKKIISAA